MNRQPLFDKLARFEVQRLLGQGGFAQVFLAYDPKFQRQVALKVLPLTGDADSQEIRQAEENGARIQRRLHPVAPHVAEVYEWGEYKGHFYIVMEYVDGEDLAAVLAQSPLPESRAVHIVAELCDLLERVHGFRTEIDGREFDGIVHGDLKPGNIRLQDGEHVRVFDFGIAKYLSKTRRSTQSRGHSIPYASPERLEQGTLDRRADLWSLGVIFYEMVSGQRPFQAGSDFELEKAIVDGEVGSLPEGCCSQAAERIIRKSLAYDPSHRYLRAAELRADLETLERGGELPDPQDDAHDPDVADAEASLDEGTKRVGETEEEREPGDPQGRTRRTAPSGEPDSQGGPDEGCAAAVAASATGPDAEALRPMESARPSGEDLERTRRTTPSGGLAAAVLERPAQPDAPQAAQRRAARLLRWSAGALALVLASQLVVVTRAWDLRRELSLGPTSEAEELWQRYRNLNRFGLLGLSTLPARKPMREALITSANRIIAGYEVDLPRRDLPWGTATRHLRGALGLGGDTPELRARLNYAQGHVDRIEAKDLANRGNTEEAREKRTEALVNFREAVRLAPDWYGPHLGMAPIFAYDDFDFNKLEVAIRTAERLGYPRGKREYALLADAHVAQCGLLQRQADGDIGFDRQQNLLIEALDHCRASIELYRGLVDFGNTDRNERRARRALEQVEDRLRRLLFELRSTLHGPSAFDLMSARRRSRD